MSNITKGGMNITAGNGLRYHHLPNGEPEENAALSHSEQHPLLRGEEVALSNISICLDCSKAPPKYRTISPINL